MIPPSDLDWFPPQSLVCRRSAVPGRTGVGGEVSLQVMSRGRGCESLASHHLRLPQPRQLAVRVAEMFLVSGKVLKIATVEMKDFIKPCDPTLSTL